MTRCAWRCIITTGKSSVRNTTLEYANLENEVGSGYSLGYYDDDREFHALAYMDETAITMVMDRNTETPGGTVESSSPSAIPARILRQL